MPSIKPSQTASPTAEAVEKADVDAAAHLARHRHHPLVRAAGALSEVADQPPLLAGCGAVLAYGILAGNARAARAGAGMLASVVVATAMKGAVKKLVSRTRPNVLLDEGHYEVQALGPDEGPWHSFPSGHTAGAVAAARALARVYPRLAGRPMASRRRSRASRFRAALIIRSISSPGPPSGGLRRSSLTGCSRPGVRARHHRRWRRD
jgi:membrane-associated phospholipid phosphatase